MASDPAAAPGASPDEDPVVVIDGARPPAGVAPTREIDALGLQVETQELFRSGGVSIARQRSGPPGRGAATDQIVVNTGAGDDDVQVAQRADGKLDVSINGKRFEVTLGPGQELSVNSNDGDDVVQTAPGVSARMEVNGGKGRDRITTGAGDDRVDGGLGDDTIVTGAGRDYAFGKSGNDRIDTGAGNDVAYAGDGDDRVIGGDGADFLDGGQGNDILQGERGNDILSGGVGEDTLRGGEDNDRVYAGGGRDTVDNRGGDDTVYAQGRVDTLTAAAGASNRLTEVAIDPKLGASVQVVGNDAFVQRTQADIEFMRSSPAGQQMLAELDRADRNGNTLTIRELGNLPGASTGTAGTDTFLHPDGTPGTGADATIRYNPSFLDNDFGTPPIGVLYHEASHAYNMVAGTRQDLRHTDPGPDQGVNNRELQAVGLENSGVAYDFDRDPKTAATTANPKPLTENGLREEMGLAPRPNYLPPLPGSPTAPAGPGTGPAPRSAPEPSSGPGAPSRFSSNDLSSYLDGIIEASMSAERKGFRAMLRDAAEEEPGRALRSEAVAGANQLEQSATQQRQTQDAQEMQAAVQRSGPGR